MVMFIRLFLLWITCWTLSALAADPVVSAFTLKRLVIAESESSAASAVVDGADAQSVFVLNLPLLANRDFEQLMRTYIGQPITNDLLNALANSIAQYARSKDRLIVKVQPPSQDISAGVFRLSVVLGRYNDLQFKGNKWFSSKLLQEKLGIKAGDEVRLSVLEDAVSWANANPFRQVKVLVNDLADQPGKADLIVGVEERIPLRLTLSFDDSGSAIIGNRRYTGALQFGNLWGVDHQGSYQYSTTDHQSLFQSHAIDYRIPLRWRHFVQFNAGYLTVKPTFGAGGAFTQTGKNIVSSVRYTVPIRGGDSPIEFSTGIDFKQGNNSLAYGGLTLISNTTDTFQISSSISMVRRDQRGAWLLAANIDLSPGNVNSRNTDAAFGQSRLNARARYATTTFSAQRVVNLDRAWTFFSRAVAKAATANVPGSEQLSIGGSATVRGFDERIYSGDQGFVFSNDLQSPPWRSALPFLKNRPPLETRFIAFYDAAQVFYLHRDPSDPKFSPLASTGVGIRMSLPANFNLTADYGWQITHLTYANPTHSRGHIKVVLAF